MMLLVLLFNVEVRERISSGVMDMPVLLREQGNVVLDILLVTPLSVAEGIWVQAA